MAAESHVLELQELCFRVIRREARGNALQPLALDLTEGRHEPGVAQCRVHRPGSFRDGGSPCPQPGGLGMPHAATNVRVSWGEGEVAAHPSALADPREAGADVGLVWRLVPREADVPIDAER